MGGAGTFINFACVGTLNESLQCSRAGLQTSGCILEAIKCGFDSHGERLIHDCYRVPVYEELMLPWIEHW